MMHQFHVLVSFIKNNYFGYVSFFFLPLLFFLSFFNNNFISMNNCVLNRLGFKLTVNVD